MALFKPYDPRNWYWKVAGSTSQVFFSGDFSYKPVADASYTAFTSSNNPSNISSAGDLVNVLLTQLEPFYFRQGVAVTSTGTPSINGTYSLLKDDMSRLAMICALIANSKGLPGGQSTFVYPDVTGNFKTFNSTNILNLAAALSNYIFEWESALVTGVNGGTASFPTTPLVIS